VTFVLVDVADGVATLTLNNPAERNTLTAPMVEEIVAAMDRIEADDGIGAVRVLRSSGLFSVSVPTPSRTEVRTRAMRHPRARRVERRQ